MGGGAVKKRQLIMGVCAIAGMFFLILDRETAVKSMEEGLKLCFHTVIPGLFPFFYLTTVLNQALYGCKSRFLKPVLTFMGIPQEAGALLIPAFLGGYPMGAKAISDSCHSNAMSRAQAVRLLTFCSNAGPAFFFGILPVIFEENWMIWSLWAIHILSAFLISLCIPAVGGKSGVSEKVPSFDVMESSVRASALVCGWILCFRVLSGGLSHWILWRLPDWGQALTMGLLELTNGCSALSAVPSWQIRYILASGLMGFGGLCVTMQTASILGDLPIRSYLTGKITQSILSVLFALSVTTGTWPLAAGLTLLTVVTLISLQKRSGKRQEVIV